MGRWDALFWFMATGALLPAMVFVGVPVLVAALALRRSPRLGLRCLAVALLAIDAAGMAALLVAVAHVATYMWQTDQKRRVDQARTFHLATPQVVAGTALPAGSTVHLNEDGSIEHGTVPVPTSIAGLLLVGDFALAPFGVGGTLAVPAELDGAPCGAGRVWWREAGEVSCMLERGYSFAGHELAAGTRVETYDNRPGPRRLQTGTLAQPEWLFDVSWPAGTVLRGTSTPPEGLAHGPPPDEVVQLCLVPGQAVAIPGATLHGAVTFEARGTERTLYPGCDGSMYDAGHDAGGDGRSRDGYAEVGPDRYVRGRKPDEASLWQWGNDDPAAVR